MGRLRWCAAGAVLLIWGCASCHAGPAGRAPATVTVTAPGFDTATPGAVREEDPSQRGARVNRVDADLAVGSRTVSGDVDAAVWELGDDGLLATAAVPAHEPGTQEAIFVADGCGRTLLLGESDAAGGVDVAVWHLHDGVATREGTESLAAAGEQRLVTWFASGGRCHVVAADAAGGFTVLQTGPGRTWTATAGPTAGVPESSVAHGAGGVVVGWRDAGEGARVAMAWHVDAGGGIRAVEIGPGAAFDVAADADGSLTVVGTATLGTMRREAVWRGDGGDRWTAEPVTPVPDPSSAGVHESELHSVPSTGFAVGQRYRRVDSGAAAAGVVAATPAGTGGGWRLEVLDDAGTLAVAAGDAVAVHKQGRAVLLGRDWAGRWSRRDLGTGMPTAASVRPGGTLVFGVDGDALVTWRTG